MNCPKCGSRAVVVDTIPNPDDNETYRKRECPKCREIFYTIEFEVEYDELFRKNWAKYARHNDKNRKMNKEKNK